MHLGYKLQKQEFIVEILTFLTMQKITDATGNMNQKNN